MRSPKKKPFSNSRKRSKFKIINWPEYNNILRNRGRIDFMISNNLEKNLFLKRKTSWVSAHPENFTISVEMNPNFVIFHS